MKKLATYFLLLTYFLVSTGFVVSFHYCMDRIDGIEIGAVSDDKCDNCGMVSSENSGCCKDKVKVVKMQVDQVSAKIVKADFSLSPFTLSSVKYFYSSFLNTSLASVPVAHGPPLNKQDTYLQIRVFRI